MEIVDVEEKLNSELINDFRGLRDGFVQVGDKKWLYPSKYRKVAEELKNFEVRSDDIWIMGYPRSGTSLTEGLVWELSHNLGSDTPNKDGINEKVRFFEINMVLNEKTIQDVVKKCPEDEDHFQNLRDTLKILNSYKTRRVIKTHLPFELLPPDILNKGCKVIYVCRFPKDVCVSYFHLQSGNRAIDFGADFQKFWRYFRNGNSMFGPYFQHVKQGFEKIGTKNFLFTFYEEFKKDNTAHIQKLSQLLEIPLNDNDLKKLENYINIDNFRRTRHHMVKNKENKLIDFVRSGKVGGWRDYFTQEMIDDADAWIEENTRKIGFRYLQQEE